MSYKKLPAHDKATTANFTNRKNWTFLKTIVVLSSISSSELTRSWQISKRLWLDTESCDNPFEVILTLCNSSIFLTDSNPDSTSANWSQSWVKSGWIIRILLNTRVTVLRDAQFGESECNFHYLVCLNTQKCQSLKEQLESSNRKTPTANRQPRTAQNTNRAKRQPRKSAIANRANRQPQTANRQPRKPPTMQIASRKSPTAQTANRASRQPRKPPTAQTANRANCQPRKPPFPPTANRANRQPQIANRANRQLRKLPTAQTANRANRQPRNANRSVPVPFHHLCFHCSIFPSITHSRPVPAHSRPRPFPSRSRPFPFSSNPVLFPSRARPVLVPVPFSTAPSRPVPVQFRLVPFPPRSRPVPVPFPSRPVPFLPRSRPVHVPFPSRSRPFPSLYCFRPLPVPSSSRPVRIPFLSRFLSNFLAFLVPSNWWLVSYMFRFVSVCFHLSRPILLSISFSHV